MIKLLFEFLKKIRGETPIIYNPTYSPFSYTIYSMYCNIYSLYCQPFVDNEKLPAPPSLPSFFPIYSFVTGQYICHSNISTQYIELTPSPPPLQTNYKYTTRTTSGTPQKQIRYKGVSVYHYWARYTIQYYYSSLYTNFLALAIMGIHLPTTTLLLTCIFLVYIEHIQQNLVSYQSYKILMFLLLLLNICQTFNRIFCIKISIKILPPSSPLGINRTLYCIL